MIYDLDNSTVEAISDGNDTESGNQCFSQLSQDQLDVVEAIAMDMSAAFVKSAKANIPLAETKIVHDRFHVMKLASEAVDKVRRGEHRKLLDSCFFSGPNPSCLRGSGIPSSLGWFRECGLGDAVRCRLAVAMES